MLLYAARGRGCQVERDDAVIRDPVHHVGPPCQDFAHLHGITGAGHRVNIPALLPDGTQQGMRALRIATGGVGQRVGHRVQHGGRSRVIAVDAWQYRCERPQQIPLSGQPFPQCTLAAGSRSVPPCGLESADGAVHVTVVPGHSRSGRRSAPRGGR